MQELKRRKLLFSNHQIKQSIQKLTITIQKKYANKKVVFCPLMTGALPFAGELFLGLPKLDLYLTYTHFTRYLNNKPSNLGLFKYKPNRDEILNQHVLLVDDIFDEGITIEAVKREFLKMGAKTVESVVLFYKEYGQATKPDFFALKVPNEYVFGFGLDSNSKYRNLPDLYKFE